jgi:hypothetical protein
MAARFNPFARVTKSNADGHLEAWLERSSHPPSEKTVVNVTFSASS